MPNPTIAPKPGVEYIALEDLSADERKVFDLALDALSRPATARRTFFVEAAKQMALAGIAADIDEQLRSL